MGMMPLRITLFFHAFPPLVYSIFFNQISGFIHAQEENDQAFSISR